MSDAPLILGVSGLRGIVGESLTPEVAVRYAQVVGSWAWGGSRDERTPSVAHGFGRVAVARDGRKNGEAIYHAVVSGLISVGFDVLSVGVATTPTLGVVVDRYDCSFGIVVTASHNPQEWNGIKVIFRDQQVEAGVVSGSAPSATQAGELIRDYEDASLDPYRYVRFGNKLATGRSTTHSDGNWAFMAHKVRVSDAMKRLKLLDSVPALQWDKFVVVTDSVNASGRTINDSLLCAKQIVHLFSQTTGIFPHTPEPTKENLSGEGGLCDAVPGLKADVGFAQDPDADRLAIVDEKGNYIGEEYTLVLCAMALMEARVGQGGSGDGKPVFVVNLSTSRMIDDVAKHYGGEVVRTAVGEANVVEAMKSLKASGRDVVLGGEGNGGVIWSEVTYVRDSLSGMALVLSLMARTGKTVSDLVEMVNGLGPTDEVKANGYTIIKKKSALAKKSDADPVVEHLRGIYEGQGDCRVDLQDGIRIDWDAKGVWAHVRASNTEPIMRVIVEAPSSAEAESVAAVIDGQIGEVGEGTSH